MPWLYGVRSAGKPTRVRAVMTLSVAALLCMLALVSFFLWQSRERAIEAAELNTKNLAEAVGSRVSAEFKLLDSLLRHAAHDIPQHALDATGMISRDTDWARDMQALAQAFPSAHQLFVFDAEGAMLYSSGDMPRFSIADRVHFQRLRDDPSAEVTFSRAHKTRPAGRWGLVQLRALRDAEGRFMGVVSAVLYLDGLSRMFGGIDVGSGGLTLLRSTQDSRLVLRVPRFKEQDFDQPLPATNPIRRRIEAGARAGSLTYTADTDGVRRVASFKRLDEFPFYVQVAVAETQYLAAWRDQAALSAALALLVMAGFGLVTLRLVKTGARADRALRQLQTSEQRLREAQGIAHMGSWEFDHRSGQLQWSEEMFRILDVPAAPGAADVNLLMSRVHPHDAEKLRRSLDERRNGGESRSALEYRLALPDGRIRHVHEAWKTHFDGDGSRLRCMGTLQDITVRKELEQAIETERRNLVAMGERLEESRNLLQAVIDEAPVMIILKDRDGKFLLANEALARFYQTTPQAMVGRDDAAFNNNAAQLEAYLRSNRAVIDGGRTQVVFEESTDAATGEIHYFQSVKVPFEGPGRQRCVLTIATDVTELRKIQLRLQASEQRMAYVLAATEDGIYDWHIGLDRVDHNARWGEILGLREVPPLHSVEFFAGLLHPEDRERVLAQVQQTLDGQGPLHSEHRMLRPNGEVVWVLDRGQVVERADDGTPLRMAGSISDITARKQAEARLALAASVFSNAREAIIITDAQARIIDVNEAFSRITGYSADEVLGENPSILKSQRQAPEFFEAMWNDLRVKGFWEGEIWNRGKYGREHAALTTITAVRDERQQVSHYVSLFSDITAAKDNENLLRHFAHFDALTGLPNRVLLADRLGQAMASAQRSQRPLALAYVDLDGFKAINDTCGHKAGDHVLLVVAERMKESLRDSDTIARLGGDEFVAVLTDLDDEAAVVPLVERLLKTIARSVHYEGQELQVSGSIGVTFYPQPSKIDADQLLRQADQAMYQAKLAGKNRHHEFDVHQHASLQGHYEQLERIRLALEQREFELHFQPKVHMRSGRVLGAEALLRWRHPQRGMVPPLEFLPLIAQHPLEIDVGWWVIETTLAQMETWAAQGLQLPVSVNVTGFHLQQPQFLEQLGQRLDRHAALPRGCLELEVLESSALHDIEQVSDVIEQCRERGVDVALDDFGTGYSTLTHLRRLPVRELKIDRSFVQNMLHDTGDLAILEGIIGLARAFQRDLVAEGVESVAHGAALLQLGCEVGQGYGIARPMPGGDVPAWVASWRPDVAWRRAHRVAPAGQETQEAGA